MSATVPSLQTELLTSAIETPGRAAGRRPRWALLGAGAAVANFAASEVYLSRTLSQQESMRGSAAMQLLTAPRYHVAELCGLVGAALLLLTSTAWKRWAEDNAPRDLAARTIGPALAAVATLLLIGYAALGSLGIYLPGGSDHGWMPDEGLYNVFTVLDFGTLFPWWFAVAAAGCVAALSFRPQRLFPRWIGVASVLLALPPVVLALATGLPGFPGLTMPVWLLVVSLGTFFSGRTREV